MPVPDFQDLMLPILKALSSGNEMRISEVKSRVAEECGLTDDDLAEWLPSRSDLVFDSRAAAIRLYLKKAGLVETARRGIYKITPRGSELLATNPAKIDLSTLKRYPEFRDYWSGVSPAGKEGSLVGHHAKKGVFITTSHFSSDAEEYVRHIEQKVVLIGGKRLAQLLIDANVGVEDDTPFILKRVTHDYFDEEE